jgi:putative membrane protein
MSGAPTVTESSEFGDPSRRTYLATERTLLAWWRSAYAAIGVALAVGRLLPDVAHLPKVPFLILGAGWGLLACALIVFGSVRQRRGHRAIQSGSFLHLHQNVASVIAGYTLLLIIATVIVSFSAN